MLTVKVYVLNEDAEEEVAGEYRLVGGKVEVFPPDSRLLNNMLDTFPVEGPPERWMRTLHERFRGTYAWAGEAEGS